MCLLSRIGRERPRWPCVWSLICLISLCVGNIINQSANEDDPYTTRHSRGPGVPSVAMRRTWSIERWAGGDGATGNAESTKERGWISRASEVSGTRPRQTYGIQAEGAPGPHGIDMLYRWRGEGLRGREAHVRLLSRIGRERHRHPCADHKRHLAELKKAAPNKQLF